MANIFEGIAEEYNRLLLENETLRQECQVLKDQLKQALMNEDGYKGTIVKLKIMIESQVMSQMVNNQACQDQLRGAQSQIISTDDIPIPWRKLLGLKL